MNHAIASFVYRKPSPFEISGSISLNHLKPAYRSSVIYKGDTVIGRSWYVQALCVRFGLRKSY